MKLYLIRHGDPDYENDSLTERGHAEVGALVDYLRGEGIDEIVSSPLGRARATAGYASDALGLEVETEPWLAELELKMEQEDYRSVWDIHGHLFRNASFLEDPNDLDRIPELPARRVRETLDEIRAHSDRFLARHGYVREGGIYRVEKSNSRRIAVFAHGGLGLSWLSLLLEIPAPLFWSGFFLHTSSVTQILFDEREPGVATPRCLMVGALPHLHAAGLEPGRAGIRANYT